MVRAWMTYTVFVFIAYLDDVFGHGCSILSMVRARTATWGLGDAHPSPPGAACSRSPLRRSGPAGGPRRRPSSGHTFLPAPPGPRCWPSPRVSLPPQGQPAHSGSWPKEGRRRSRRGRPAPPRLLGRTGGRGGGGVVMRAQIGGGGMARWTLKPAWPGQIRRQKMCQIHPGRGVVQKQHADEAVADKPSGNVLLFRI